MLSFACPSTRTCGPIRQRPTVCTVALCMRRSCDCSRRGSISDVLITMSITYFLWSGWLQGSRCEYPSHAVQCSLMLHIRREMGTKEDEELLLDKERVAKKPKIEIASPTLVTHIPPSSSSVSRKSLQEESGHPHYQLLQKIPLIPCPCAQRPVQHLVTRSAYSRWLDPASGPSNILHSNPTTIRLLSSRTS